MITREYTGNYRNDNDEENDESAWVEEGEGEERGGEGKGGERQRAIGCDRDN